MEKILSLRKLSLLIVPSLFSSSLYNLPVLASKDVCLQMVYLVQEMKMVGKSFESQIFFRVFFSV